LRLGKGEEQTGGRNKESLLGNSFEALLGAVFLDGGYPAARGLIERVFTPLVDAIRVRHHVAGDYKSILQERLQARNRPLPSYQVVETSGPAHERRFVVECRVAGVVGGTGDGRSKRMAEQQAARAALLFMEGASGTEPAPDPGYVVTPTAAQEHSGE
jgi:ribonuclease-3